MNNISRNVFITEYHSCAEWAILINLTGSGLKKRSKILIQSAHIKTLRIKSNSIYYRTTAAWKAIVGNGKVKCWQVFCDYNQNVDPV
jgi:hypothetical protein